MKAVYNGSWKNKKPVLDILKEKKFSEVAVLMNDGTLNKELLLKEKNGDLFLISENSFNRVVLEKVEDIEKLKESLKIKGIRVLNNENFDEIITEKVDNEKYKLYFLYKLGTYVLKVPVSFKHPLPKDVYFKLKDKLSYFKRGNSKKGIKKGEFYITSPL